MSSSVFNDFCIYLKEQADNDRKIDRQLEERRKNEEKEKNKNVLILLGVFTVISVWGLGIMEMYFIITSNYDAASTCLCVGALLVVTFWLVRLRSS